MSHIIKMTKDEVRKELVMLMMCKVLQQNQDSVLAHRKQNMTDMKKKGKKGCNLNEANGILISFGGFRVFSPIHSVHSWLYGESPFLRNLFVCVHF